MIVVRIELHPGGDASKASLTGLICISNDGTGTNAVGNYDYALSHSGKFIGRNAGGGVFKKGKVKGFARRLSVYRLIQRCLKHSGEV